MSKTAAQTGRTRVAAVVAALGVAMGATTADAGASRAPADGKSDDEKKDIVYVVMAHPDDETSGWQLIDDFAGSYVVFVTLTHGEGSAACLTKKQSWDYPHDPPGQRELHGEPGAGPYRYEGPRSRVGQPDEGERRPFGNPWQGRFTPACGHAKVASWHWFLDDVEEFTPGLPDFDVSASRSGDPWASERLRTHCPHPTSREDEQRDLPDQEPGADLGCVDVWTHPHGARVVFDVGDIKVTRDAVVAALDIVRAERSSWGIPQLPETAMVAAAPGCAPHGPVDAAHSDHEAVQNALYDHDFGAGTQYGIICDGVTNHPGGLADKRFVASPGPVQAPDALTWWRLNETAADPDKPGSVIKIGPMARNYGWIAEGSTGTWDFPFHMMWKRFG